MRRRDFIQATGAALLSASIFPGSKGASLGSTASPPNILYINVDDLGWADLGYMGSSFYETPNLDRLARSGIILMDAYVPAANCAPSRAAVWTGQYAPRTGVYTVGNPERGNARFRRLIPAPNEEYIKPENTTWAEVLREAGYSTVHLGKWHISDDPLKHGFDENHGGYTWGHPQRGYFSPYGIPNFEDGPEGEYLTDRLVDEAIGFLERHDGQCPFMMALQTYTVHTPLQAKPEVVEKYRNKTPTPSHHNPEYAAMIEHLDTNIGRLVEALDDRGLKDNTLIFFTSDNGGIHDISCQAPLRGEKGSYYEGGIRVPTFASWPGVIEPGGVSKTPVSGIDLFPTFMEVAGIPLPAGKLLDGTSILPLLKSEGELPERPIFWHFPVYLQRYGNGNVETRDPLFRTRPGSAVRLGRYKLLEFFEDGALELYDLELDIGERNNLAEMFPEKTRELHDMLKKWREDTGALMPLGPNPRFDEQFEQNAIRRFYTP